VRARRRRQATKGWQELSLKKDRKDAHVRLNLGAIKYHERESQSRPKQPATETMNPGKKSNETITCAKTRQIINARKRKKEGGKEQRRATEGRPAAARDALLERQSIWVTEKRENQERKRPSSLVEASRDQ